MLVVPKMRKREVGVGVGNERQPSKQATKPTKAAVCSSLLPSFLPNLPAMRSEVAR